MSEHQLDLFADARVEPPPAPPEALPRRAAADLDDAALVAGIDGANLADATALAAEAGRRRLAAAVPTLAALCRRFAGFGLTRRVPEQAAALEALARIGGRAAAEAVAHLIARALVQGPTLGVALGAAARLGATLPVDILRHLLRHAEPAIRADACRCARPTPELIASLIGLLDDPDQTVATSAACALARMGRGEPLAMLTRLLREHPSAEVIEAVAPIADEACVVLLGRIARTIPSLTAPALDALDAIDDPRAGALAADIRRRSAAHHHPD